MNRGVVMTNYIDEIDIELQKYLLGQDMSIYETALATAAFYRGARVGMKIHANIDKDYTLPEVPKSQAE